MIRWLKKQYWLWRYWTARSPKAEWDAHRELERLGLFSTEK